jgi:hypothetical protein
MNRSTTASRVTALILLGQPVIMRGQGTVYFANYIPGVLDAPVFMFDPFADSLFARADDRMLAQLFAGRDEFTLAPIGSPVRFAIGATAGYWAPQTLSISSVTPGERAYVQVRARRTEAGATWEAAVAANHCSIGSSTLFHTLTGEADGSAATGMLLRLTSFSVGGICPEIPVGWLMLVGLGVLLGSKWLSTTRT